MPKAHSERFDELTDRVRALGSVHACFSQRAAETPDQTAILSEAGALTYGALEQRASQLARRLRALGVQCGQRVGLLAQRGPDAVIALLAVLKAGAAYVPLDLAYPATQLAHMLALARPALVLADDEGARVAGSLALDVPVRTIASLRSDAAAEDPASWGEACSPRDLAYVMFTSGSHGAPKGVSVRHQGILRLVHGQGYARFGPEEVFLHMAPLAFDASTFELWGALLHGARLVILADTHPSLARIGDAVRTHGVTTAWLTAGLFHLMVEQRLGDLAPLRQLLAGGDVLSVSHVRRALAALPACTLINGYGPTENTTFTCCYRIPRDGWGEGSVPIGHPLVGTTAHVLDASLAPVADGEVGELCTGGLGVAAGYLGSPPGSEARFVRDPFATEPDARMYRTGDLVRRREDGALEFLGRADRQVKIDGKRVELDEIEQALGRAAGVASAAVVQREDVPGQKRLVGYLTVEPARAGDPDGVRREAAAQLRRVLPRHMVPTELVVLAALPLTVQGKLDRRALPAPVCDAAQASSRADEAGAEPEVRQLFARVLGVAADALDPEANFFDLGGSSLQLVEVHAELARRVPSLSAVAVWERPSVRGLARLIEARAASGGARTLQTAAAARARAARRAAGAVRARAAGSERHDGGERGGTSGAEHDG